MRFYVWSIDGRLLDTFAEEELHGPFEKKGLHEATLWATLAVAVDRREPQMRLPVATIEGGRP